MNDIEQETFEKAIHSLTVDDKALVERLKCFSTRLIEHDAPAMNRVAMKEAADCIEAQSAEIERLRVEVKAQYDRGYYDGYTRASLEARGLEIREKNDDR
ncbi:hypothetical protein UFOVP616_8 [uncultured Caudovirales phage]|uniref:Uncharacterized protein n=1 Tax=uncultured Caudovirales phage TaxID=2100421 RepID=A0A6J5N4W2_9CAUD|nr:hypothetical protein UFOVP616_8 [uncultured Caudovirales phage]